MIKQPFCDEMFLRLNAATMRLTVGYHVEQFTCLVFSLSDAKIVILQRPQCFK